MSGRVDGESKTSEASMGMRQFPTPWPQKTRTTDKRVKQVVNSDLSIFVNVTCARKLHIQKSINKDGALLTAES